MAEEIEKKYRLSREQFETAAGDLNAKGAEFFGSFSEVNLIFSSDELASKGAVARIRTTERGSTLTFKRRLLSDDGFKRHIEHETVISDAAVCIEILRELGLSERLIYEKRRRAWKFLETEVVLDELPFGLFMEIEGSPEAIVKVESALGADIFETEPETYPMLTEKLGISREGVTEARF